MLLLAAGELGRVVLGRRRVGSERVVGLPLPFTSPELLHQTLDRLLSLERLVAEDAPAMPPRLHVWALVDASEAAAAAALQDALGELYALLERRYAPLFPPRRRGDEANLLVNPIVVLPAAGEPWSAQADALIAELTRLHELRDGPLPPLGNVFVVGRVSGRYRLDDEQLARMIGTFVEQATSGPLSAREEFLRLLSGERDAFATFVCASCELDDEAARDYLATRCAIDALSWLRRVSAKVKDVDQRAGEVETLFDVGRYRALVPLEKGRRRLAQVIDTQCPDFAPAFRDHRLLEDGEELLSHYSEAWARDKRERLRRASRELSLFRLDETIEEVEANGATLVAEETERIDHFVDEKLAERSEGNVADAALLLRHLRKRLAAEVESAQQRATEPLAQAPDLGRFDRGYEQLVTTAEAKPRRRRLLVFGALLATICGCTLALLLRHLVPLFGLEPGSFGHTALTPNWAWLSAALISTAGVALFAYVRLRAATRQLRRLVGEPRHQRRGELLRTLGALSRGADNSLLAFHGSRFQRACDIWVHRTLRAVLAHVERRYQRLTDMLAAFEQQVHAAEGRLRAAGLHVEAGGEHDTSRVLIDDQALTRCLIDPAELSALYQRWRRPRQLPELVQRLCEQLQPFTRWRRELPLADLEALVEACRPFHQGLAELPLLEQPELAEQARERLRRFFADLARRLDFHLDFRAGLFRDDDDVSRGLSHALVVDRPVAEQVRELLETSASGDAGGVSSGASGWEPLVDEGSGNRVVLLKLVTGIAADAIDWHRGAEAEAQHDGEDEGSDA
jgi:hypothetical protein